MYNDVIERTNFLNENKIHFFSEPISIENLKHNVVNPTLNFQLINKLYQEKNIVVIDNFLLNEYVFRLRKFMLTTSLRQDYYSDYAAVNFYKREQYVWFSILSNVVDELKRSLDVLRNKEFIRAWSFIYEEQSKGVNLHADPAAINFNLWVTPNECLNLQDNFNGMIIWPKEHPKDWSRNDYNGNCEKCYKFLQENNIEPVSVEYKFNRMVMFNSAFFHKSQPVSSKTGYGNRRVNYSFLFE